MGSVFLRPLQQGVFKHHSTSFLVNVSNGIHQLQCFIKRITLKKLCDNCTQHISVDKSVGLEKNEETYNILISLHCTLNQLDKALTLLEKVHRKYNGLINTDVLSAVVAKFLEGDAFDEALELMNSVADIDQETCGMMFKYALLKRSEEDAAHLLGLMRSQDFRVDIDLIVEAVFERYGSKCDPIPLIVNLFDKCGARVDPRALALAFAKKNHVPALIQAVNKVFSENLVVSETWKTEVMYALVNANDMELAMEVMTWNIPFGQFAQTSVVPKHAQMQ
eukprot:TRINITY_DN11129_c0_g1_i3.p1 TRINITY_DN11129_c0_g1~~TRINITY_DN11129_c0_g1_i3.p1  ORF type:complete len:278 (-),score=58.32 TRINITY_DN11129_c0_g1_i3:30-863(-)